MDADPPCAVEGCTGHGTKLCLGSNPDANAAQCCPVLPSADAAHAAQVQQMWSKSLLLAGMSAQRLEGAESGLGGCILLCQLLSA